MSEPEFLTVPDILTMHSHQIERFGGSQGIRDVNLLASAVAQAESSFEGVYVHKDLFAMAAAYLFHLVSNHAFVDGNKRVGLAAALIFLDLNGAPIEIGTERLYELTMAVARGELGREEIAACLRELAGQ